MNPVSILSKRAFTDSIDSRMALNLSNSIGLCKLPFRKRSGSCICSKARISSRVVIPPAAVISCVVLAKPAEPFEIRSLHHSFFVNVGAQESAAIRLKLTDDCLRRCSRLTRAIL